MGYVDYIEFLTDVEREERKEEIALDLLRNDRRTLFVPFDLWEKAVLRGREDDSEDVMLWYNNILNLNEDSFDNIPEAVSKYAN